MADDTAALVLSLEARFDKFEKAMTDATKVVDKQTRVIEQRFEQMTKVITNQLATISNSLTSQLGAAGSILTALGPLGTTAAVGIGALIVALNAASDAAERVAQKAIALREFSIGTGTTVEEAQGLRKAFNALGVDTDKVQKAFELFAVQLNELRKTGAGPLADALNSIDTALVGTMLQTNSTMQAFELFIRTLGKISTEARNAASRSAGGRGGIGAFAEMADDADKFFAIMREGIASAKTAEQIKAIVDQSRQLTTLQKENANLWDKMFPTDAIMRAKISGQAEYNEMLRATLLIIERGKQGGAWEAIKEFAAQSAPGRLLSAARTTPAIIPPQSNQDVMDNLKSAQRLKQSFDDVAASTAAMGVAREQAATKSKTAREQELANVNEQIAALTLLKSVSGGAFSQANAFRLESLQLRQKELQLGQPGIALINARIAGERFLADSMQLSNLAIRERLGVATEAEILTAKSIETQRLLANATVDAAEKQRIAWINAKEAREKYEAALVRSSSLPGLTRLALDAQNLSKQFDQFAVTSLNTFTDSLADAITGTKSLSDAFRDMTNSILKDLARIIIRQTIVAPLLGAFSIGGIAGRMAGGPVLGGTPYIVGERGPELFVPQTPGTIVPNKAITGGAPAVVGPTTNIVIQGSADERTVALMQQMLAARDRRFVSDVAHATTELRRRSAFA